MRLLVLGAVFLFLTGAARAEVVVLNGVYQGKDLYIKNPVTQSGVGFCIFEVLVNGQVTSDEVNSPSFAIDLGAFGFKVGTPIEITLRCKEACDVKIINPEAIYPTSTFEAPDILLGRDGLLSWRTTGEMAALAFSVEQFKWNRWVKVGEVQGKGGGAENAYSFSTYMHSGPNVFRVSQLDHKGSRYSPEVRETSNKQVVTILNPKITKTIDFSAETDYEIYSEFGALIKAGRGTTVDVSRLNKGRYYINFDNKAGIAFDKK